jgi:hypothetical protein
MRFRLSERKPHGDFPAPLWPGFKQVKQGLERWASRQSSNCKRPAKSFVNKFFCFFLVPSTISAKNGRVI